MQKSSNHMHQVVPSKDGVIRHSMTITSPHSINSVAAFTKRDTENSCDSLMKCGSLDNCAYCSASDIKIFSQERSKSNKPRGKDSNLTKLTFRKEHSSSLIAIRAHCDQWTPPLTQINRTTIKRHVRSYSIPENDIHIYGNFDAKDTLEHTTPNAKAQNVKTLSNVKTQNVKPLSNVKVQNVKAQNVKSALDSLVHSRRQRSTSLTCQKRNSGSTSAVNSSSSGRQSSDNGHTHRRRRLASMPSLTRINDDTPRLVFIGERLVGKTSMIDRFTGGISNSSVQAIIKQTKYVYNAQIDKDVRIQFWDVDGGEPQTAIKSCLRAHAAVIVFDMTNRSSFQTAQTFLELVNPRASSLLIANKLDLKTGRKVSYSEGRLLAKIHKVHYIETSVLDNHNVDKALQLVLSSIPEEYIIKRAPKLQQRSFSDPITPIRGPH